MSFFATQNDASETLTKTVTKEDLWELVKLLKHHFDPDNQNGFVRDFYPWVIQQWTSRSYYATEYRDGNIIFPYPVKTQYSLAEKISCYADFLEANTGSSFSVMYMDGPGTMCEPMIHIFGEMYEIELEAVIEKFVDEHQLVLPKNEAKHFEDVSEALIEGFQSVQLRAFGEEIEDLFERSINRSPDGNTVYTTAITPEGDDLPGRFGHWTLEDFRSAVAIR